MNERHERRLCVTTGEMTDGDSVKKRLDEGRELRTTATLPPPPPTIPPKASGSSEGPDKRQMRYLLRRALFAFEEALGMIGMLGSMFPELQPCLRAGSISNYLSDIIVRLRDKLIALHDEGEPMTDIPEDDGEQLAMQYLGEIPSPRPEPIAPDTLSGEDMRELSRRLGGVPASERIAAIRDALKHAPRGSLGEQAQRLTQGHTFVAAPAVHEVSLRQWLFETIKNKFKKREK